MFTDEAAVSAPRVVEHVRGFKVSEGCGQALQPLNTSAKGKQQSFVRGSKLL